MSAQVWWLNWSHAAFCDWFSVRTGKSEHSIWKLLEHVGFARKEAQKYDLVLHKTVLWKNWEANRQKLKITTAKLVLLLKGFERVSGKFYFMKEFYNKVTTTEAYVRKNGLRILRGLT